MPSSGVATIGLALHILQNLPQPPPGGVKERAESIVEVFNAMR